MIKLENLNLLFYFLNSPKYYLIIFNLLLTSESHEAKYKGNI